MCIHTVKRRDLVLVCALLGAVLLYFILSQGYWAPGYAVRLSYTIPEGFPTDSPFVLVDLNGYASLSRADLRDILVTDTSGTELPWIWYGEDRILVYAKDLSPGSDFYVFVNNPAESHEHNVSDLNGYYSLTVYSDVSDLCQQAYQAMMSRHNFDYHDMFFVCYGTSPDQVFGAAWSGDPDDGTSNRRYYFVYHADGTLDEWSQYISAYQQYARGFVCAARLDRNTVGCTGMTNGSEQMFKVEPGTLYFYYDTKAGGVAIERVSMGLTIDMHPLLAYMQNTTSSRAKRLLGEITPSGFHYWGAYSNRLYDADEYYPFAVGSGAGIFTFSNAYTAIVYPNYVHNADSHDVPDCGASKEQIAYLSDGTAVLGKCRIKDNTFTVSDYLPEYGVPRARVSSGDTSCYLYTDGNYSTTPYIDLREPNCYFPLDSSVFPSPFAFTNAWAVGAHFAPILDVDVGRDYYVFWGMRVEDYYFQTHAYHFRYDSVDTQPSLGPVSPSAVEAQDSEPPAVYILSADLSLDYDLNVHVFASDAVGLSRLDIVVWTDSDPPHTWTVLDQPTLSVDATYTIPDLDSVFGTDDENIYVKAVAYDVAGNTSESSVVNLSRPRVPTSLSITLQ